MVTNLRCAIAGGVLTLLMLGICGRASAEDGAGTLVVYAAGSLKGALTEVETAYAARTGVRFNTVYGPAGLLANRLMRGEKADIFISADMGHPNDLVRTGLGEAAIPLLRNRVCALVRSDSAIKSATLLETMLQPETKVATSTPKSDPGGDYALEMFARAESVRPGAEKMLTEKALPLVGGERTKPVPSGWSPVEYYVAQGDADVFIGYCSRHSRAGTAGFGSVELPENLKVVAQYGLTIMCESLHPVESRAFADYLKTRSAQETFQSFGFESMTPGESR